MQRTCVRDQEKIRRNPTRTALLIKSKGKRLLRFSGSFAQCRVSFRRSAVTRHNQNHAGCRESPGPAISSRHEGVFGTPAQLTYSPPLPSWPCIDVALGQHHVATLLVPVYLIEHVQCMPVGDACEQEACSSAQPGRAFRRRCRVPCVKHHSPGVHSAGPACPRVACSPNPTACSSPAQCVARSPRAGGNGCALPPLCVAACAISLALTV